ncbi:aromatic-ring-hydroxylating dioxygenase subunit beta [Pseudacidovorax intermedius]|uniref:Aromatic-ring-hydroxylating dioxygenase n=1 Tax=Pseudacidovorax intermedius TaxID=433924 RepID=A0A147H2D7_9BURK|nr:aromatic-ring-hydroxylating dioxygenase subunit beta [Pseudacidovorax intermedius]KTT24113.1 aromatic-ring-hydroxylating dioxygenase [Pseudacidovorax intermedius]
MTLSAEDFVVHEAELIDDRRWDDWLALFAPDGRYWIPLQGAAQADADSHNALALEDRLLLELRVKRLHSPRAHSQHPASRCQHVLQAPRRLPAAAEGGDTVRLRTAFLYVESRGPQQVLLAGHCVHTLVPGGPLGWLIREKRVNLLDAGQPLPAIQLFV